MIVFDGYHGKSSTKDMGHQRHTEKNLSFEVSFSANTIPSLSKEDFFCDSDNDFLCDSDNEAKFVSLFVSFTKI